MSSPSLARRLTAGEGMKGGRNGAKETPFAPPCPAFPGSPARTPGSKVPPPGAGSQKAAHLVGQAGSLSAEVSWATVPGEGSGESYRQ